MKMKTRSEYHVNGSQESEKEMQCKSSRPRKRFMHPATMFFLLGIAVVLLSWVGSVYNWNGVQNLLSTEAMRWILRYSKDNLASCPAFVSVCILFMGGGLFIHSGLWDAIWRVFTRGRRLSGKEKSSLAFAVFMAVFYISIFSVLAWGPWNIVRGVTGTFAGSPLHDGLVTIISMGIGLTSVVYGFSSDYYRRDTDVINGMSYLFSRFSSYFVSLFFAVQFLASLQYSGLADIMGLEGSAFYILQWVCYLIPLSLRKN